MEHLADSLCEMHAVVKGQVQGVGFRATTRYIALELGLRGSVRNLPDGSVEIYAQGSKLRLEQLIKKLKSEIGLDYIKETSIEYSSPKNAYPDFRIL